MLLLDRGSEVETDAKINMYEQEGASTSNGYHSGEIDSISWRVSKYLFCWLVMAFSFKFALY